MGWWRTHVTHLHCIGDEAVLGARVRQRGYWWMGWDLSTMRTVGGFTLAGDAAAMLAVGTPLRRWVCRPPVDLPRRYGVLEFGDGRASYSGSLPRWRWEELCNG